MKPTKLILLTVLALATFNCSIDLAGGSGSETTNGIYATVKNSEGQPAQDAQVKIVHREQWDSLSFFNTPPAVDTAADDKGRFFVDSLTQGEYLVRIDHENEGITSLVSFEDTMLRIDTVFTLQSRKNLSGTITADQPQSLELALAGTPYVTTPKADGTYEFPDINYGHYSLIARDGPGILTVNDAVRVDEDDSDAGNSDIQRGGLFLDTFDDAVPHSMLNDIIGASGWYAYTDEERGGNSTVEPEDMLTDITAGMVSDNSWRGNSLQARFLLRDGFATPHASIACSLFTDSTAAFDATSIEKISFMARGTGSVRIFFVSDTARTYPLDAQSGHFGHTFSLSEEWTEITIPADSFVPVEGTPMDLDGLVWDDAAPKIYSFVIGSWGEAGDDIECAVDEIFFHGIGESDINQE
ncbi:MAG: hypothetical protein ACQEQ4_09335 [Fibrobacterota bacterium]